MANGNGTTRMERWRSNGGRKFITGALAGGFVTLALAAATALIALGGERQRVLEHVASTEPLRTSVANHLADRRTHMTDLQSDALARLPVQVEEIQRRLAMLEASNAEILREIRRR